MILLHLKRNGVTFATFKAEENRKDNLRMVLAISNLMLSLPNQEELTLEVVRHSPLPGPIPDEITPE
jgi:hypothetical protein